jgi:hypothetical protein
MAIRDFVPIEDAPELVQSVNTLIGRMGFKLFESTEDMGNKGITVSRLGYSNGSERIFIITNTAPRPEKKTPGGGNP